MFEKLALYWAYPFVRYALAVGVLIALCSSLLGMTLVLKRFSFIGDGLSHVAFGAMAVAAVLGLTDDMPLTLGITIVSAILLLRTGQNTKIKGDAAIAMISVGSLAIGYLLMNIFSTSSPSFLRRRPWSTNIQVKFLPIALLSKTAATDESTPPDRAHKAFPLPIFSFKVFIES